MGRDEKRLLEAIRTHGVRCMACGEALTSAERRNERTHCVSCWPDEVEYSRPRGWLRRLFRWIL